MTTIKPCIKRKKTNSRRKKNSHPSQGTGKEVKAVYGMHAFEN
jgi:hypothetical protein